MCRISQLAWASVSRRFPATRANAGAAGVYKFTCGVPADQGALTAPPWPALAATVAASTSGGAFAWLLASSAACSGSVSQDNCSSMV